MDDECEGIAVNVGLIGEGVSDFDGKSDDGIVRIVTKGARRIGRRLTKLIGSAGAIYIYDLSVYASFRKR